MFMFTRLTATMSDGNVIERDYHYGTTARMLANMEKIAPEYASAGATMKSILIEYGVVSGQRRTLTSMIMDDRETAPKCRYDRGLAGESHGSPMVAGGMCESCMNR